MQASRLALVPYRCRVPNILCSQVGREYGDVFTILDLQYKAANRVLSLEAIEAFKGNMGNWCIQVGLA